MIAKGSSIQAVVLMAVGSLLGYAAAIVERSKPVVAAPAAPEPRPGAEQTQGTAAAPAAGKPNILVIMGDDIGWFNPSCYNRGMLGFQTPNIDRIASEGALFTTYYGQQSCTAGRAAFILGQCPFRTGLTKVGLPGASVGLQKEDPTIAELLKNHGYATGQFGKNHLGDKDQFLPTAHGFDEFFGNLYHLNAEEEPENPDYPKDPAFRKRFGPRGVLKATSDGKITDTGPLTRKRMETVDEEFLAAARDFIQRQTRGGNPFFVWFNSTKMHVFTHLKPESAGKTGLGIQGDGMVEHDGQVGALLALLDELKVADNTLVVYTTDNGAMKNMWPDGGISPFRSEKDTNWEGAVRVPCAARWPGVIKPGTVINGLFSAEDWLPTFLAAAGEPDVKEKLLKGHTADGKPFKVHLDGYNQLPFLKGAVAKSPRKEFVYFDDDGKLVAYRDERFKYTFSVQYAKGMQIWSNPLTTLRVPMLTDLSTDPFEYAVDGSPVFYDKWVGDRAFLILPAVQKVSVYLSSYREFPPRQRPASFSIDQVLEKFQQATRGN